MTMRKTPFLRMRYPFTSDVVSAADVQAMASDIDSGLIGTAKMASEFSRFASVTALRAAAQSITKATLTAITLDTIRINNGANSPLANANWWAAGQPTRLTAPVGCIVLVSATSGYNIGSAFGVNGAIQTTVGLNGGAAWLQGKKFNPLSTYTGQVWASAMSMWKLNAGDYLELKTFWTGTPAGPINTDTGSPPIISLAMIGLTSVP
jgi:hypothetical protein